MSRPHTIGEAEHLKRNLCLLAEPCQLENLKEAMFDRGSHRPRKIKHEHDAVILAVLLDDLRQEDIVMGAVLVKAIKVEHPGLLGTLTPNLVRSLPALKLGDQLAHERIGLPHELAVFFDVQGLVSVAILCRPIIVILENLRAVDDAVVQILNAADRHRSGGILLALLLGKIARKIADRVPRITLLGFAIVGLAVSVAVALCRLHLLQALLNGGVFVEHLGDHEHIIESFDVFDQSRKLALVIGHGNVDEAGNAPLEVNVQAVDDVHGVEVHVRKAEHIPVDDLLVAQEEVPARTGVLALHQLLNANILNDIADAVQHLGVVALLLRFGKQLIGTLLRSPQGMADLMGDEHRHHGFRHIPHRHDEMAGLGIERCGGCGGIKGEREVLRCESAGKDGERSVHIPIMAWLWHPRKHSYQYFGRIFASGNLPNYYPSEARILKII